MSLKASLPSVRQAVVDQGGTLSRPYYVHLQALATSVDALASKVGDVTVTPAAPISPNANVTGAFSIYTQGTLKSGIVRVLLQGDTQTPGNTQYYGSDGTGTRGWFNVADTLDSTSNITLTVGTDGVTTFDLANLADSGTGAALVKITRDAKGRVSGTHSATTSDLAEGTNLYFTNARASAAAPVQSVFGRTGAVVATTGDYTFAQIGSKPTTLSGYGITDAATSTQGSKADSAVQSVVAGTNITVNNADPRNPVISASGGGGGTGTVPFFLGDSSAAYISLSGSNELPFFLADGTASDIPLAV